MGLFNKTNKNNGGLMDVIRCDEPSYLIWKWHPAGSQLGDSNRDNSIRWGSSLRVKDGEVAVFVYKQKDGTMQDYIVGPFDETIKTKNFPVLTSIVGLAFDGNSPFQAEIYFINLAKVIQVKFGVPFFDVYDPRFSDFGVPVAVRGTISFEITNYREFIKLHRLSNFNLDEFQRQIRDAVNRYVKDAVANAPAAHNIPVVQIESKVSQINDAIEYDLKERLSENFGVTVSGVDISAIEIDKSSDGFRQLKAITADVTTATIQGQTAANIENYAETLRIQREEAQYAQHKATQSANLGAFQIEKQAEVGVAGAEALGKMGSNGAGGVDLGGSTGFNPAAMMAGMALGGAVGQNIASAMNGAMSGVNNPGTVPPPIPTIAYHVAVNGQAAGPYDISALAQMVTAGQLTVDSLVWKNGMAQWAKAGSVDELKNLFANIMPPIPPIV